MRISEVCLVAIQEDLLRGLAVRNHDVDDVRDEFVLHDAVGGRGRRQRWRGINLTQIQHFILT